MWTGRRPFFPEGWAGSQLARGSQGLSAADHASRAPEAGGTEASQKPLSWSQVNNRGGRRLAWRWG